MKKTLKIGLIALAGLLVLAVVVAWLNLSSLVKAGIQTMGPKLTGCAMTVDSVSLSPLTGAGSIKGLVIGNPQGFSGEPAVRLGEVRVKVALGSLMSDRIVVNEIYVDAPDILYEVGLGSSNIGRIQKNLEAGAGPPLKKEEAPAKPGKKVQIDHVLVKSGRIRLSAKLLGGKALPVPLPDIEMKDIGKDSGGTSVAEAVSLFFARLAEGVVDAVKKGGSAIKEGASGLLDGTGNLFK